MGVFQSRSKLIAAYRTELRSILGGRRTGRMGGKSKLLIAIRCLTGVPVTACVLAPSACRNVAAEITIRLITGRAYCFVLASGCATGAGICFGVAAVLCAGAGMCSVTVGDPCTPDMGVCQSRSKLIAAFCTELRSILGGCRTGRMGSFLCVGTTAGILFPVAAAV